MKSTGILRRVDELGRVVLPIELRRSLDIEEKDPLEISVEEDRIILRKYQPTCIFCGAESDLLDYRGKKICAVCQREIVDIDIEE